MLKPPEDPFKEQVAAIGERHGWDEKTTREKVRRTKEILALAKDGDAIEFLIAALPNKQMDVVDKLDDDNPPF